MQEKLAAAKNAYQRRRKHDRGKQQRRHARRAGPSFKRPMETTSKARANSGRKIPVNIERQLGAAADQSTSSKFILSAMIIEQGDYL